jgi:hypothetical protein
MEKTGAVVVGPGSLPDGVPSERPRWALLELDEDGALVPSEEGMREWGARLEARMTVAESLLEKVDVYNAEMRAFVQALGPALPLGKDHYRRIRRAVLRFERAFGPKRLLSSQLAGRYFKGQPIPGAWLHWPRSAGGLGLLDPLVELVQYRKQPNIARPKVPSGWSARDVEMRSKKWAAYYEKLLQSVAPAPPAAHERMDALARDFTSRLSEMKGKGKEGAGAEGEVKLAPYWRWVLATYGQEVLARFGTYRFLLKALVPLDLIRGGGAG